jgi:hypothetical protein
MRCACGAFVKGVGPRRWRLPAHLCNTLVIVMLPPPSLPFPAPRSVTSFVRRTVFFPAVGTGRFPSPVDRLEVLKRLFADGLRALVALQQASVMHNDLLLRNMLVRWPQEARYQLAMLDFCQATIRSPDTGLGPGGRTAQGVTGDAADAAQALRHLLIPPAPGPLSPHGSSEPGDVKAAGPHLSGTSHEGEGHFHWGGSPGATDQFGLACTFMDLLYLPHSHLFSFSWRSRSQCYTAIPSVSSKPPPHLVRGQHVPYTTSLGPSRCCVLCAVCRVPPSNPA